MAIALVTGGSRGIGRATALLLAQEGYTVAVNYQQNLHAAREHLPKDNLLVLWQIIRA